MVHPRQPVPEPLKRLAALQDQVVTRKQALALGLNRHSLDRLVDEGSWQRLARGVNLTHRLEPAWESLAWAGVLIGGDHARLGGMAAGHLHGLISNPPRDISVLIPPERGLPRIRGWSFHRESPGLRLPSRRGSPPMITVEDTVLDLATVHTDERHIIGWVTEAVQSQRTTAKRLTQALVRRQRHPHRQLFSRLLEDVAAGAQSNLEVAYLRDVERAHGLPRGSRQMRRGRTYCDVCYERYGLLVELDGHLGHVGMGRFRDMARDNSATSDGLATLRYGSVDVLGRPCEVAHEVGQNLTRRGWTGLLTRCRRCLRVS